MQSAVKELKDKIQETASRLERERSYLLRFDEQAAVMMFSEHPTGFKPDEWVQLFQNGNAKKHIQTIADI